MYLSLLYNFATLLFITSIKQIFLIFTNAFLNLKILIF